MPEQEPEPNLLDQAVDESIRRFWVRESYTYKGHLERISVLRSAREAVITLRQRTKLSPGEFNGRIIESTSLIVDQVMDGYSDYIARKGSMRKFLTDIATLTVMQETYRRDPNIEPEERRRMDKFPQPVIT